MSATTKKRPGAVILESSRQEPHSDIHHQAAQINLTTADILLESKRESPVAKGRKEMTEKKQYVEKSDPRRIKGQLYMGKIYIKENFDRYRFEDCAFIDCLFRDCTFEGAEFNGCAFCDTAFSHCEAGDDVISVSCKFYGEVTLPKLREE